MAYQRGHYVIKKLGVNNVEKLQTINLMECDFNHGDKRLAKLVMAAAKNMRY